MADEQNQNQENKSEGMSVSELENFGKKYRFEIFFFVYFVLATVFNSVFFSMAWNIYLAGIGAVLGIWFPSKVECASKGAFGFIYKQERATQIVLACVGILIAFFLPPIIFLGIGLMAGAGTHHFAGNASNR